MLKNSLTTLLYVSGAVSECARLIKRRIVCHRRCIYQLLRNTFRLLPKIKHEGLLILCGTHETQVGLLQSSFEFAASADVKLDLKLLRAASTCSGFEIAQ